MKQPKPTKTRTELTCWKAQAIKDLNKRGEAVRGLKDSDHNDANVPLKLLYTFNIFPATALTGFLCGSK